MNINTLLDTISNLQIDNPDKISSLLSLTYTGVGSDSQIYSNNNIFDSNYQASITNISSSLTNETARTSAFSNYSSSYSSYLTANSLTSQTTNLLNSQKNVITNLLTSLNLEGGSLTDYITSINKIINLKLNNEQVNTLISCSLGVTGESTDELDILARGRLQFAKELVQWINGKIGGQNVFYLYNTKNIKLNYSDDDGYDSTYAQLKTENQYNFYDQNYEQQSFLADVKLLPGMLHQTMLYYAVDPQTQTGLFNSPENSLNFALKQIYGNSIPFTTNNSSVPTINYSYYPNVDGETGQFQSSLYSNWDYENYRSGSYVHPNDYQPINEERTKLNNLNIHVNLSNLSTTSDLYINTINNYLNDKTPFYAKVNFSIPKQDNTFLVNSDSRESVMGLHETALKTIYAAMVNNLYVDGQIIDESKLLLDTQYTSSSVNINLLKFFRDNYNTESIEPLDCETGDLLTQKQKLKIGKDTGELDEIFSSLGLSYNFTKDFNVLGVDGDEALMQEFVSAYSSAPMSNSYNNHLLQDNNDYSSFFKSSGFASQKTYLFSKISKYEVTDDGTESFVQNFYFDLRGHILNNRTATDDITYTFYDNQIHSGKRYNYVTTQIIVVPALAYGYTAADVVNDGGLLSLDLGLTYIPVYKLIEIPTTTQSDIVVLEKPPVTPAVLFLPILDKKDKILIEINPSGFDKTEIPISIEDEDVNIFDKVLESQNSTTTVNFSKDFDESGISSYEIYRIESYPFSYNSFSGAKIATITASDLTRNYYDSVLSNTDYYYCIRSKNYRGIPSNPTKVYKIRLVEDGEFYTLNQEIIENLNEENIYTRNTIKNLKRFMYIAPSTTQTTPSEIEGNATDAIVDYPLSTASKEVWGKKFKIRVRSKSSGKTIDFNVIFNKNNNGEFIPE
jgi:hypothetical protein